MRLATLAWLSIASSLCACTSNARLPVAAGTGPHPELPPPASSLVPLVNVAKAVGWQENGAPVAAAGLQVNKFAQGLDHPRWLFVLPNGDVLVAETNAQEKKPKGVYARIQRAVMARAGATAPSAERISLLRDADGDGVAETRSSFLSDLTSPFGMALVGDRFYVANTDAVLSFPYVTGDIQITAAGTRLVELPAGDINHHWTKNLVASADGKYLYASIGSNSDHGENGMENEEGRAAIWQIETATGAHRIFASGLRNPVGLAFEPGSDVLWTAVNERDDLGGDLVPDYMTSVIDGAFYGWPYVYYGDNVDPRVKRNSLDLLAQARVPDYALGPHTASLGLTFAGGSKLGPAFANGAFVGQHGSWNRKPRSGYKVIFVPFTNGKPAGQPVDVLTGFLNKDGDAQGRPVGVVVDKTGALLVADDVGNIIWRVTSSR